MITRTINAKDVPKVLAHTRRTIQKAHKKAILEAVVAGAELVATRVPVDTGALKRSVRPRKKGRSGYPEIVVDAPHAGVIEAGGRAHWAPLRPLIAWTRRKVGRAAKAAGIRVPGKVGVYKGRTAAAWRRYNSRSRARTGYVDGVLLIARAVQRKIAVKGTRAHWYMKNSLPELRQLHASMHEAAHAQALRDLGTGGGEGAGA